MFNFTHVLNATTGQRYYIDKAVLSNDEGYNDSPDSANWFEIDLQPENPEESPIIGIDLIIWNNGEIHITRNLDADHRYKADDPSHVDTVTALIEGKTLIITNC